MRTENQSKQSVARWQLGVNLNGLKVIGKNELNNELQSEPFRRRST